MPESRDVPAGNDEVAGLQRLLVHRSAVRERSKAHLRDIGAGEPVRNQSAHGISIAEALIKVAHVEMSVERDQAHVFQIRSQREHCGPVTALFPPTSKVSAWAPAAAP